MSTDDYRKCAKCGITRAENSKIKYHRFPRVGGTSIIRATAWATYCWPDEDWSSLKSLTALAEKNKVLCGRHFQDSCYTDINRTRLTRYAVPGSREYINKTLESLQSKVSVPSIVEQDPLQLETTEPKKKKRKGILKPLGENKLSQISDTEQKLYKVCRNKIRGIHKLKNKIKGKNKADKIKKICNDASVKRLLDLNLNNAFTKLLESQLINCGSPKQDRKYNLNQKILALTLYQKSPSCYHLLTNIFELPCPDSLDKMLDKVRMTPGINEHVFSELKSMVGTFTNDDSICALVFDEMALRKNLNYNTKLDCVDGFEDHGIANEKTGKVASNALVFMLCGLTKQWKQPVAFYFTSRPANSDRVSQLIEEVLTECFGIGLNVVATVCDMSPGNVKALNLLGATTKTPYFKHDGREIVTIADPPHLLKSLRNTLMVHEILIPIDKQPSGKISTGTATWDHIRRFYDIDSENTHFVYAPALTEKHVNPNLVQKRRVKFATQVFSHTVTAGILARIATNELPAAAHATAVLLTKFDALFDALNANSQALKRGKKYSSDLTARSPHLKYFDEMKNFIREMYCQNAKMKSGWIQTLTAVERLWKNLRELDIQSLSTRRLNLDPLSNLFACVRYNSGATHNPTTSQFIAGFKTALITNLKNCGQNKNCEDDEAVLTNNFKSFLIKAENQDDDDEQETQENHDDFTSNVPVSVEEIEALSSEMQACAYICGIIVKNIDNSCTQCTPLLTSNVRCFHCPIDYYNELKKYNENLESLKYASCNLVKAVESTAGTCKTFFSEYLHSEKVRELGMLALESYCKQCFDFLKVCHQHYKSNMKNILYHVFMITLKRCIILKNRYFSQEPRRTSLKRKLSAMKN